MGSERGNGAGDLGAASADEGKIPRSGLVQGMFCDIGLKEVRLSDFIEIFCDRTLSDKYGMAVSEKL
jgi:hypothetical protein